MLTWLGSVRSPFVLTGIVIAVFLQLLNARGLFAGYSYWNDEAFSAATSLAGWKTLFLVGYYRTQRRLSIQSFLRSGSH